MKNLLWVNQNPNHTICPMCEPFVGAVFTPDEILPLPAHPNCFCMYVPTDRTHNPDTWSWDTVPQATRDDWVYRTADLLEDDHADFDVRTHYPILIPLIPEAQEILRRREKENNTMTLLAQPSSIPEHSPSQPRPFRVATATGRLDLMHELDTAHEDRYSIVVIEAGPNKNNWTLPLDVLKQAAPHFAGAPCPIDHHGWFDTPSLLRMAGTIETPYIHNNALLATLRLNSTPSAALLRQLIDAWLEDEAAGLQVPDIGLSAVLWLRFDPDDPENRVAQEIIHVESVDAVLHPAAGGRVERVLNSLGAAPPDTRSQNMPEEIVSPQGEPTQQPTTPPPTQPAAAPDHAAVQSQIREAVAAIQGVAQRVQSLTDQVESLTAHVADQQAERTITGLGLPPRAQASISMGRTGLEQVDLAFQALLDGTNPPNGIQPLSGIRELYMLLSGDYELTGHFQPERVYLANVNSSTMAALVANRLNKVVVNQFMSYPHWWDEIVTITDFSTLQDARWITLGGVGELPTVSEGAAYTELTWDDNTETASFVKKGGYLGITIEAIDKDDTRKLRMAPLALAQGAWLTLGKSISAIFTSNSGVGPTLADSIALFNASHSNLGSTALSHAAWVSTRTAMRKQTEINSSERLGALTTPKFLLVPPDLEVTGLQILATEHVPGSANWAENPFAVGNVHDARLEAARRRLIVVDLWTDTNDWAAVADPNLYPSIGLGFRYGRAPEIFSVASPTAGLMFSNDVMPVKVRFFYATGPIDYRGLYKQNVA